MRVADVARIEDGQEEGETLAIRNGERGVVLSVRKQADANTVAVVDAVRERMADIAPLLPPGVTLEVARDNSETIRTSASAVTEHLVLGAIFAALVVLLFLGHLRSTIIAALAIPISLIGTFALMWIQGFTLNTITLLALALAVGIVIDDAIVVLENIFRFVHEKKMPPAPGRHPGHQGDRPGGAGDHPLAAGGVPAGGVHGRHRRPLPAELRPDHGLRHRHLAVRQLHPDPDAGQQVAEGRPPDGTGRPGGARSRSSSGWSTASTCPSSAATCACWAG